MSVCQLSVNYRHKLLFEMLPGYHTQNLVSEIYRLTENLSKQGETRPTAFDWLDKYKSSGKWREVSGEMIILILSSQKYLWLPLSFADKHDISISSSKHSKLFVYDEASDLV